MYHAKLTPGLVETNCTDVTNCSGFRNNKDKWDLNELILHQFLVKYFVFKLRVKNAQVEELSTLHTCKYALGNTSFRTPDSEGASVGRTSSSLSFAGDKDSAASEIGKNA